MNSLMSASLPAVITEPNPPFRLGHRNASVAPPNSAAKTPRDDRSDRRKNSRRVTGFGALAGTSARATCTAGGPTSAHERQPVGDGEQVHHDDHHERRDGPAREGQGRHSSKNTPWAHGH